MAVGFVLLLAVAVAGAAGLGVCAPVLGGIVLHLTVASTYWELWERARGSGKEMVLRFWAMSVLQAVVAAGAAYALGLAVAWVATDVKL